MKSNKPILYIKSGCPWCESALTYFDNQGVELDIRDVRRDRDAMRRMVDISGQTLTPTFEYEDFVVADFSVDEFIAELEQAPEVQKALGIDIISD